MMPCLNSDSHSLVINGLISACGKGGNYQSWLANVTGNNYFRTCLRFAKRTLSCPSCHFRLQSCSTTDKEFQIQQPTHSIYELMIFSLTLDPAKSSFCVFTEPSHANNRPVKGRKSMGVHSCHVYSVSTYRTL